MTLEVNQHKAVQQAMEARRRGQMGMAHSLRMPLAEDNPFAIGEFESLLGENVQHATKTGDGSQVQDDGTVVRVPLADGAGEVQPEAVIASDEGDQPVVEVEEEFDTDPTDAALAQAQAQQAASAVVLPRDAAPVQVARDATPIVNPIALPKQKAARPARLPGDEDIGQWIATGRAQAPNPVAAPRVKSHPEPQDQRPSLFPEVTDVRPTRTRRTEGPAPVARQPEVARSEAPARRRDDRDQDLRDARHDDRMPVAPPPVVNRPLPDAPVFQSAPATRSEVPQRASVEAPAPIRARHSLSDTAPAPVQASFQPPPVARNDAPLPTPGPDPRLLVKPEPPPVKFAAPPLQAPAAVAPPPPMPAASAPAPSRPAAVDHDRPAPPKVLDDPTRLAAMPPAQVIQHINEGVPVTLPVVPSVVDRWVQVNGPTLKPEVPKTFSMSLAPPDLGPMTIQFTIDAQQRMSIEMTVGTPMAKAALDQQMMSIRQIIQVNQFSVGELTTQVAPVSQQENGNKVTSARGSQGGKDAGTQGNSDAPQRRPRRRRQNDGGDMTVGSY